MKKILLFLFLIPFFTAAQHTIQGFMSPKLETDWVILYKIEGTKQVFINNTTIKQDSLVINGSKKAVGSFTFNLPATAKVGAYRATYRMEGAGFVDFFYNKENVSFIFNPEYPQQSIAFTKSKENKVYQEYLTSIIKAQETLDSIQVAYLQNKTISVEGVYKKAYEDFIFIQNKYEKESANLYISPFVKSSPRKNSPELLTSAKTYLDGIQNTFFDKLDFSNKALINSSFLTNRILDYVFYINYTDDVNEQQSLYKSAIATVLSKIKSPSFKKDVIEFLVEQFEAQKNVEIIDYLFQNHYKKLPINLQNQQFIKDKEALLAAEIGRVAPDFSWTENGKNYNLSTLNDAEIYVLVFWSTSCSHCLREIPQLHAYLNDKENIKVVAFALENDALVWENYKKTNLYGWHNVLGLNKWENKTARTYNITSTPSYFVLDKNKKIIAKPYELKDVKTYFDNK